MELLELPDAPDFESGQHAIQWLLLASPQILCVFLWNACEMGGSEIPVNDRINIFRVGVGDF